MTSINKTVCADINLIERIERVCGAKSIPVKWSDAFKLGIMEKIREVESGKSLRQEVTTLHESLNSLTALYQDLLKKFESKEFHYDILRDENHKLKEEVEANEKNKRDEH